MLAFFKRHLNFNLFDWPDWHINTLILCAQSQNLDASHFIWVSFIVVFFVFASLSYFMCLWAHKKESRGSFYCHCKKYVINIGELIFKLASKCTKSCRFEFIANQLIGAAFFQIVLWVHKIQNNCYLKLIWRNRPTFPLIYDK